MSQLVSQCDSECDSERIEQCRSVAVQVNSSGVSFREHPQLDAKAQVLWQLTVIPQMLSERLFLQAINGRPTPGLSYCDLVTVCGEPVEVSTTCANALSCLPPVLPVPLVS